MGAGAGLPRRSHRPQGPPSTEPQIRARQVGGRGTSQAGGQAWGVGSQGQAAHRGPGGRGGARKRPRPSASRSPSSVGPGRAGQGGIAARPPHAHMHAHAHARTRTHLHCLRSLLKRQSGTRQADRQTRPGELCPHSLEHGRWREAPPGPCLRVHPGGRGGRREGRAAWPPLWAGRTRGQRQGRPTDRDRAFEDELRPWEPQAAREQAEAGPTRAGAGRVAMGGAGAAGARLPEGEGKEKWRSGISGQQRLSPRPRDGTERPPTCCGRGPRRPPPAGAASPRSSCGKP